MIHRKQRGELLHLQQWVYLRRKQPLFSRFLTLQNVLTTGPQTGDPWPHVTHGTILFSLQSRAPRLLKSIELVTTIQQSGQFTLISKLPSHSHCAISMGIHSTSPYPPLTPATHAANSLTSQLLIEVEAAALIAGSQVLLLTLALSLKCLSDFWVMAVHSISQLWTTCGYKKRTP